MTDETGPLTVTKHRIRQNGRQRTVYCAHLGRLDSTDCPTAAAAKADVIARAARIFDAATTRRYDPEIIRFADGEAIVVSRTWDGRWEYHFDRSEGYGKPGRKSGWCVGNEETREEVLAAAIRHARSIMGEATA